MKERELRFKTVSEAYQKFEESTNTFLSGDNISKEKMGIIIGNMIDNFNIIKEKGQDTFDYINALTLLDIIEDKYPSFSSLKNELLEVDDEITKKRNKMREKIIEEVEKYDSMQKKRTLDENEVRKYFNELNDLKTKMKDNTLNFNKDEYNELLYEVERRIASAMEFIRLKKIIKGEESLV